MQACIQEASVKEGSETGNRAAPTSASTIFQNVKFPCGRRAHNRLVKVAMYEHLAVLGGGPPNSHHFSLYGRWAKHGWGMIITGNVAITNDHLTLGRDLALPASSEIISESAALPFKTLADVIHGINAYDEKGHPRNANSTLAIMQLNHSGRQSSNIIGGRFPFRKPLAPSAIRVGSRSSDSSLLSQLLNAIMFQIPKAMSATDIHRTIDRFVEGALLGYRCGFDGVQLHAAHGYLLAQFLSTKSNKREDIYSAHNALDIIQTIAHCIRESTSSTFIIGIKLNAAEYISTPGVECSLSEMEHRALNHITTMATWGLIDFIEISGGDYESPDFMKTEDIPRSQRQAFFSTFSRKALEALESLQSFVTTPLPLVLLTGGLRSLDLLDTALNSNHAHLLGIGRASVLCPSLPDVVRERLKNPRKWGGEAFGREPDLKRHAILSFPPFCWILGLIPKIKIIGAGVQMAWYVVNMRHIATSVTDVVHSNSGALSAILWMWMWMPLPWYPRKGLTQRLNSQILPFFFAALPIVAYLIYYIYFH